MDKRSNPVFRKTDKGAAEIKTRADNLPARARAVLILVNGNDCVATLAGKLGPDVESVVQVLLERGHIEPSLASAAPVSTPLPARANLDTADRANDELEAILGPLRRQAMEVLAVHYGPDTPRVAAPLLNARTLKVYLTALDALQENMEIYLGRKLATKTLAALRPQDPAR
jgi:hypothetical protein